MDVCLPLGSAADFLSGQRILSPFEVSYLILRNEMNQYLPTRLDNFLYCSWASIELD